MTCKSSWPKTLTMEERIKLSRTYIIVTLIMVVVGIAALVMAFMGDPTRGWANILLNNVYFVSLAAGALLFASIQRVTHSGWSAGRFSACGRGAFPGNDFWSPILIPLVPYT